MATPTTGTQAPGGQAPPPFPPFQGEHFASQLFWLALAFVLLYVLMAKVALPRVGSILQARRDHVAGNLMEAQHLRERSEVALAQYEKALADARNRAQGIATETRDRLMGEAEENRKGLEAKLNAHLAEAERSIASTKQAAMVNVHGIATDATAAIVEKLIGTAPDGKAVEQAVTRALER
jgi:F-type H+-transporting ATPase subunit b